MIIPGTVLTRWEGGSQQYSLPAAGPARARPKTPAVDPDGRLARGCPAAVRRRFALWHRMSYECLGHSRLQAAYLHTTVSQVNPNLYQLIHELVLANPAEPEKRRRERLPFDERQRVAQCRGSGVPDDSEFREVRCHDLSQGGFSFLFRTRPHFRELVVAFGIPPGVIYVAAEIVHCTPVLLFPSGRVKRLSQSLPSTGTEASAGEAARAEEADEEGEPYVLVGCRFLERLNPSA